MELGCSVCSTKNGQLDVRPTLVLIWRVRVGGRQLPLHPSSCLLDVYPGNLDVGITSKLLGLDSYSVKSGDQIRLHDFAGER